MSAPRPPAGPDPRTRDHLANQRTFLAWIRTALGLIGLGFVLARMGLFLRELEAGRAPGGAGRATADGGEFLLTGLVVLVAGTVLAGGSGWLYHRTRAAIDSGRFEPSRHAVTALTAVVTTFGLLIVALLVRRFLTPG